MQSELKIAQIGCGHWGQNLARNFAQLGVLAAVSDENPATAASIGGANGAEVRTFDEVLADESIAAVALATPAPAHGRMALRALAAGKDVFVEKPLALANSEGLEVVEAAERGGRVFMVGHLLQYHPLFLKLKELVDSGELGALQYVYSNRLSLGKLRVEENVLWSFAPHDISMILGLSGQVPQHVTAEGAAVLNPGIADWATCHMRFPSGLRGHVQTSWIHPVKEQRLVVVGAEGMAVFEDSVSEWDRRLVVYPHRVDQSGPAPVVKKGEARYLDVERAEPLRLECEHFIQSVRSRSKPRTDGREGLRVLAVLTEAEEALQRSLQRNAQ